MELLDIAKQAALAGGKAIMLLRDTRSLDEELKDDGSLVTAADKLSQSIIFDILSETELPILAEEKDPEIERYNAGKDKTTFWAVDPLDGTKEFAAERDEFAVCVGLVVGGNAMAGAVYAPAKDRLWYAFRGRGAYVSKANGDDERRLSPSHSNSFENARLLVSSGEMEKKYFQNYLKRVGLPREQITSLGSTALKAVMVASGEGDMFISTHNLNLEKPYYVKVWDLAAAEAIVVASEGLITGLSKDPYTYDFDHPTLTDGIFVCDNVHSHFKYLERFRKALE